MRVTEINNSNFCIQKINNTKHPKYISQITFTSGIDKFEKSTVSTFKQSVKNFYTTLQNRMGVVQSEDIAKIAENIAQRTGFDLQTSYKALDMITTFSSYKSLDTIEKGLYKKQHFGIKTLPLGGNLFANRDVCLADTLKYISKRNFRFSFENKNPATIVDTSMLNSINNAGVKLQDYFADEHPLVISTFENSYNFLNQAEPLEDFTLDKLARAKYFQNKNGKNILYNLNYVLNGKTMSRLNKKGIRFEVIKPNMLQPSTPEKIANNLNPIMPDFDSFYDVLQDISKTGDLPETKGQAYVLDIMNNLTDIATPQKLSQYLKKLHSEIQTYILENHRDRSKIFYTIPNSQKSFSLANYMYAKANNIKNFSPLTLIHKKGAKNLFENFQKLPNGSTIVLIDDYMLSGLSLFSEQFNYDFLLRENLILNQKDINIIFAPIFASKNGKTEFENIIKFYNRGNKDKIITAKELPAYKENFIYNQNRKFNQFQTSSVLPYMGPDTNPEEFIPIYEMFLYNPNAQKTPVENIGDIPLFSY